MEKNLLNSEFIKHYITTNREEEDVKYRWSHGATDLHLGDGLVVYSLIQYLRAKTCVCLGSGGGFIPRIMTQARVDLHTQKIFNGNAEREWGDIGTTILVDANNGKGGEPDWIKEGTFFRDKFGCRIIIDTSENAYYNFFVKQDIKIDVLFIDADHSYAGIKKDFDLYSSIVSPHGIIIIHDTDIKYHNNFIVTDDIKKETWDDFSDVSKFIKTINKNEWQVIDLFNHGIIKDKPSSTGITIIKKYEG